MPNLDPATRARLADALQGATPEMLRGDAEFGHGLAAHPSLNDGGRDALRRLAALALAVAEMQERSETRTALFANGTFAPHWFVSERDGTAVHAAATGMQCTSLPAALASLLREAA